MKAASRPRNLHGGLGRVAPLAPHGSIPKPICVLRGLPNYGSGLRSSNVSINACMKPKPALQVLVACRHKAGPWRCPWASSTPLAPIDCPRRLFVDVHGQKGHPRGHLNARRACRCRRVASRCSGARTGACAWRLEAYLFWLWNWRAFPLFFLSSRVSLEPHSNQTICSNSKVGSSGTPSRWIIVFLKVSYDRPI